VGEHVEEQADIGFAEAVDRLHRIADQEHRAAIVRRPARGQLLEQREVTVRGVLELVDQYVADAVIQRQGEIGRGVFTPERLACRVGDLRVVHLTALGEHQSQACRGDGQDLQ
jgi:hypothetical protein